jgi:hypothetical protein
MSRGLGRIERHILIEIARDQEPDPYTGEPGAVLLNSWTLAHDLFSPATWDWRPSRTQRQSVTRAMRSFVRKFPQYALAGGNGRKKLYLFQPDNLLSATWAKLNVEQRDIVSRSKAEAAMHEKTED